MNEKLRNCDSQTLANLILSYEALTTNEKNPDIFKVFDQENNPTQNMLCYFEKGEILSQLIKAMKSTEFSVSFVEGSIFCKFHLPFYNFLINITVKKTQSEILKIDPAISDEEEKTSK